MQNMKKITFIPSRLALSRLALVLSVVLVLVAFLVSCARSDSSDDAGLSESGIVNGRSAGARELEARVVVALIAEVDGGQALCTGSILADDTILTAAHCVDHAPSRLTIVFGPRVQGAGRDRIREADGFAQNPRWREARVHDRGDLALVHFPGGLPTGYQTVKLAPVTLSLAIGTETRLFGYGVTDGLAHAGSGILRETSTVILGRASETEIVTDGKKSSVCFGDSGGPAFALARAQPLQWGVASSVANQSCNLSSVHTDVRRYQSWLKSTMARLRSRNSEADGHARQTHSPVSLEADSTDSNLEPIPASDQ